MGDLTEARAALARFDAATQEIVARRLTGQRTSAPMNRFMPNAEKYLRASLAAHDEVTAERDRLRDILRCERGEWAPDGWVWRPAERAWQSAINLVMLHDGGWGWCFRKGTGRRGQGTAPTALEALEAADKAAHVL